ncbi:MAG: SPOR domain-containing protein [Burkholderiaceae bacterium]|nr:SPOR domain-containing protein [Burkholderiaceae bacterium]
MRDEAPGRLVVETRFADADRATAHGPAAAGATSASAPAASAPAASAAATSAPAAPASTGFATAGFGAGRASAATLSPPTTPTTPTTPTAAHASGPGFWLQLGAFSSADGARAALERLRRELAWLGARFDLRREGALYKVQAGPWLQREHALDAAARVRGATALQPFPIFR